MGMTAAEVSASHTYQCPVIRGKSLHKLSRDDEGEHAGHGRAADEREVV